MPVYDIGKNLSDTLKRKLNRFRVHRMVSGGIDPYEMVKRLVFVNNFNDSEETASIYLLLKEEGLQEAADILFGYLYRWDAIRYYAPPLERKEHRVIVEH